MSAFLIFEGLPVIFIQREGGFSAFSRIYAERECVERMFFGVLHHRRHRNNTSRLYKEGRPLQWRVDDDVLSSADHFICPEIDPCASWKIEGFRRLSRPDDW